MDPSPNIIRLQNPIVIVIFAQIQNVYTMIYSPFRLDYLLSTIGWTGPTLLCYRIRATVPIF